MATYQHLSEEHLPGLAYTLQACFGGTPEHVDKWILRTGHERFRVLADGDRVLSTLAWVPMGQHWGGRAVDNLGIAAVGVEPESRGRGFATEMMKRTLAEARQAGFAVSTLYPSTQSLYRRVGYEIAGVQCLVTAPSSSFAASKDSLELVRTSESDRPEVERLSETHRNQNGNLKRSDYIWQRVYSPRFQDASGYLVIENDRPTGYTFFKQKSVPGSHKYDLEVTDLLATTGGALRRLMSLFGQHATLARHVVWSTGPSDPFLLALTEKQQEHLVRYYWMLRILDVTKAFEGRGYPAGLSTELELSVKDDLFPENSGNYVLSVQDGSGRLSKGGAGRIRVGARGLAALYSGYCPIRDLALNALAEGDADSLTRAEQIFRGPTPFMVEMF